MGHLRGTHSRYVIGCCLIPLGICGLRNNSRRKTYGIGCVWGMPSLSPLSSLVTDRIGRHEVLLPINHNFNKICDINFLNQNTKNSKFCFASSEKKKPFKRARDGAYCPIT